MSGSPRPLGARSQQQAAVALLAVPVLLRLGLKPAPALIRRARWGRDHDVDPWKHYRIRGLR